MLDLARRDLDAAVVHAGARAVPGPRGRGPGPAAARRRLRDAPARLPRPHRDELRPQLKRFLERQGTLFRLFTTDNRVDTLLLRAVELLGEVERDPDHQLRRWLDGLLASLADDLRYDAETARRVDAQLRALVEDPHLQSLLHAVLVDVVGVGPRPRSPSSTAGCSSGWPAWSRDAGARVRRRRGARRGSRTGCRPACVRGEHYGDTVVALISRTVAGWEARDASARIEAAVGRDLQFIRINGTVVGALAGLAIHAVAVLLG